MSDYPGPQRLFSFEDNKPFFAKFTRMDEQIDLFIRKIEAEIETVSPGSLKPETKYRDLPEWSSMYALILIALIDAEYGVTVSGEDIRSCPRLSDLFQLVVSRQ